MCAASSYDDECIDDDVFAEPDFSVTAPRATSKKALSRVPQYRPAQSHNVQWLASPARKAGTPKASVSSTSQWQPARAREQFVRNSCKLFVLNEVACNDALGDPDIMVPWEQVQYVQVQSTDEQACPICLGPIIAPKMTRCGHIYCWYAGSVWRDVDLT